MCPLAAAIYKNLMRSIRKVPATVYVSSCCCYVHCCI